MLSLNDLIEVILKFKPSRLISLKSLLMQVIWSVSILRFYLWFFCVTCKDLMSSDNRISSCCSQNLPPPQPKSRTVHMGPANICHCNFIGPCPTKNYTSHLHKECTLINIWTLDDLLFRLFLFYNMTLSFTCSVKYVNWYTFIIKTK